MGQLVSWGQLLEKELELWVFDGSKGQVGAADGPADLGERNGGGWAVGGEVVPGREVSATLKVARTDCVIFAWEWKSLRNFS